MRIINSVLGDASGGRWQVVCQYSRLLTQAGHRVCLLLDEKHRPDHDAVPAGVECLVLRNRGHYDYLAAWRARGPLRALAPDIALAHCSRSVALLKRALPANVPVLAVSHSNKIRRLLPADAWIALTRHIESLIRQQRASAAKSCFVVPNMIEIGTDQPLPPRPDNQPPLIGALGRFDRVKGFDVYLAALAELRTQGVQFNALLAGAGVERAALLAQLRRLELERQVRMTGWVEDVPGWLVALDVLCVPARSDAFGLTPLQAAVAGVPLVLSRASGHQEIFREDSEALFCAIDNPQDTARQLRRILAQPARAEPLRQAAHRRVIDQYSVPVVAEKVLQVIDTIVKIHNNS